MGNSRKESKPITGTVKEFKPMTPEERRQQIVQAMMQRKENIATGVLMAICQNPANADKAPADLADKACEIADAMIKKLYVVE